MKKSFSIAILFVFLLGSVGMTISKHYCGGELFSKNVTILVNSDEGCGMEMQAQECATPHEEGAAKDCCNDEVDNVKITDKYTPATLDWSPQQVATVLFEMLDIQKSQPQYKLSNHSTEPAPPPAEEDITVFVQSFLC